MIGLGVLGDTQPNDNVPKLVDGIHLRWGFKRELGFPWHGFFLFRRPSASLTRPACLSRFFWDLPLGSLGTSILNAPYGQLESDAILFLTEEFQGVGRELALHDRKYLHLTLNPTEKSYRAIVKIGFRGNDKVKVTALGGDVVVVEETVVGQAGQIVEVTLSAESISGVKISGGNAALTDLCLYLVSSNPIFGGWEKVPQFKYPLSLPVRHPNYPCNPNPTDLTESEGMALNRVLYGPPDVWAGAPFAELHEHLVDLVKDGKAGVPMANRSSLVDGIPISPGSETNLPEMEQYPLDLVLSASLHPAFAQMLGLYWVDRTVPQDEPFDYLIVADHTGIGNGNADIVLNVIKATGFNFLDGYILFEQRLQPAAPLPAPKNIRCYALPGAFMPSANGNLIDASNNAGVRWDLEMLAPSVIRSGAALMYHVWRNKRGTSADPDPPGTYEQVTPQPLLVADSLFSPGVTPTRPSDWPPFALRFIDSGLSDGWYSYRVSGIDIFGRHSVTSPDARWMQWKPEPRPRPWYYQDPPADRAIHSSAVRLLDKIGPPVPHGVEAYALDPKDPVLVRDALYNAWFDSVGRQENAIGLRVRWHWTEAHMRQAPDTREFRIYLNPDRLNSLPGRITEVTVAVGESPVRTDIPNTHGADAFAGAWLRVGADAFSIVGNDAATPLTLRVKNNGPKADIGPTANSSCAITIPQVYNSGTVSVVRGSTIVNGTNTSWTTHLVGMPFKIVGQFAVYRINAINSQTQLVLDRIYEEDGRTDVPYGIRFPLFTDFAVPVSWRERFHVVPFNQHVTETVDSEGRRLRKYELIITVTGDSVQLLETSLAQPVRYAHVGVSAADDKQHTLDDPKWASGSFGGPDRFGNEGPVSAPRKIFMVRREPPEPPPVPPDSERVFASPADYHSHSFYTYRWMPTPNLKTHIFRALDDAVFQTDWERRATDSSNLNPDDVHLFPAEWDALKRAQVANELNHLNTFNHETDKAQAMSYYRGLSNDGLCALAGLPGSERAFTQITILPLDPNDPSNANRPGPDNPAGFAIDPALRAYIDTLDGRSTNRYFYRATYVDGAHNRGHLSLSSPPVWLPKVVPPRTPVITKVLAGDRQITLRWSAQHEPDLQEYTVFRTATKGDERDLRLMNRVGRVAPAAPNTTSVEWIDESLEALTTYYYRIVAVDTAGNVSSPSQPAVIRAYDDSRPSPPTWEPPVQGATPSTIFLSWSAPVNNLRCLVQRRSDEFSEWESLSGWLPRGLYSYEDSQRRPGDEYRYRLRVMDTNGKSNREHSQLIA